MSTTERARLGRAVGAIAAVYVAFLLCAQFGFLAQLEAAWGRDSTRLQAVLATMGLGGLAGSFLAARTARRGRPGSDVRGGLVAVAVATAATVVASTLALAVVVAAALGGALGFATVALAGGLPALVPASTLGRAAGAGTGIAYAISNLPPLFGGSPTVRALLPAALALGAAVFAPAESSGGSERSEAPVAEPTLRFAGLVALFAGLVLVDSAAFAHLQTSVELLVSTWGGGANQLRQGAVHLVAALVAGAWIDRGGLRRLLVAVVATFAVAIPALGDPRSAAAAGIAYAAGISFYSAALVAAPGISGARGRSAARRAAGLYVVAGWIASGLGVGAADEGAFRGVAIAGACGVALFLAVEIASRRRAARSVAPALALGLTGALVVVAAGPVPRVGPAESAAVAGRAVYLAEGCQHCHSKYVRPLERDRLWWGPVRGLDRFERPPTPGNRRIGPDLSNVGARRSELWQRLHLLAPRSVSPGSRMPSYAHLFVDGTGRGEALVAYLGSLGLDRVAERDAAVAAWRPPHEAGSGSVRGGEALFRRHCAPCHGAGGRGDGALADAVGRRLSMDLTDGELVRAVPGPGDGPDDALARAIRFGLAPGTMAGHEWLSDSELADLIAWVRSLETKALRAASG